MTLEEILARAAAAPAGAAVARRALGMLDLTSLNDGDTDAVIEALCARASTAAGPVAAVCVHARFVPLARRLLEDKPVRIATVVNFPEGDGGAESVAAETRAALADGADEIDMVMPYRLAMSGDHDGARDVVAACRAVCDDRAVMKVILETGVLGEADLIQAAAVDAVAAGADFLKTSTGKLSPAATLEAVAILLAVARASGREVGVKAAGGIRDTATAARYLALADAVMGAGWATPRTFRFGASALLDRLLSDLGLDDEAGSDPAY